MTETVTPIPTAGTEPLQGVLHDLHAHSKDIQVSMVVTQDGLTMVSYGGTVDAEKFGAMCADLLALCRASAVQLQRGDVEQVIIRGTDGLILLTPAGPLAVLAVMARVDSNLGLLFLETERAAGAIPAAL